MFGFSTAIHTLKVGTAVQRGAWRNTHLRVVDSVFMLFDDAGKMYGQANLSSTDLLANDWFVYVSPVKDTLTTLRISDVRLSELLDHATGNGEFTENSAGSDTHPLGPEHPMTGARRATILAYKELQQRRAAD